MEAAEDNNGGNNNLKRQRAPLSDFEDNLLSPSEMNDGQKRRRLETAGQENCTPKPSSSRRLAEQNMKPDTPMVPSVRSRVQQLTQRQDGGAPLAQRCLSDPGADSPSAIKVFREPLLGEGEFSQRMERFKVPVFQASPAPTMSPANLCPLTSSNFVSGIQQKLQGIVTSSSKQASVIRQEREQELNQLHFQPISENAWLKRSNSDPSLSQQVDDDAVMKDGSFTETATSGVEKQSLNTTTGERKPCDFEAPPASVELEPSNEGKLQMDLEEQNTHQGEEFREGKEDRPSVEEQQLWSHQPEAQTVLQLSFSEDQSFSKPPCGEDHNVSELSTGDKQSLLESTRTDESNVNQTSDVSKVTDHNGSEVFSLEDEMVESSHNEEEIEPSTDEELRLWRYPSDKVCKQEESIIAEDQEEGVCTKEEREESESSRAEKEKGSGAEHHSEPSHVQDGECQMGDVSAETAGCSNTQEDVKPRSKETMKQDKKNTRCPNEDDRYQQSKQIVDSEEEDMELESDRKEEYPFIDVAQAMKETQTGYIKLEGNTEDVAQPKAETEPSEMYRNDGAHTVTAVRVSDHKTGEMEMQQEAVNGRQGIGDGLTDEIYKAEGGESSKKVTFILEPKLINGSSLSETNTSMESRRETSMSDAELSSHDETNTAEIIDQMFEEVLEYAERIEDQRGDDEDTEDRDSGIGVSSRDKDKMDTESEKEKSEEEGEAKDEECDESKKLEDELLTFPPSGILSPLSKSVEAVVTPLRLEASQESNPPSLLLTPEETTTPPAESAPLYSIDAYRTQRQSKPTTIQSVTPGVQRRAPEKSRPQPSVNTKEKITALNEEAGKLQTVINQTLQALSCCTDEEHGRGSVEEAVAEKLLLVSCEKRSALLAEVDRLREERSSESSEVAGEDQEYVTQQPCRGTVSITNIQLPLKVEFVCSSNNRTGRPSHYFFVLIRYGPYNIVATPLATAADAQNGDTISFQTSVTLKDIRSTFEIDVEVYSLSHTSPINCSMDRTTTKSRVTPRKLLNTLTRSSNSLTSAALPAINTRRSSNFCLVGSHKITLASLGHSKFPLDKMKLEGKIRRLLGDEFQEKVPFLSPLEGNIYLKLDSESHSNVQHQGFLTMFELIGGFGVWRRGYFTLERYTMYYWNHPNDKETKEAEGSISLSSSPSQCVRPVKRDSCARPFTFELASNIPQQQDDSQEALAKCWFAADTKQERSDWMEKLNQALLDFHTWNRTSATQTESQQASASSSGNLRESIL